MRSRCAAWRNVGGEEERFKPLATIGDAVKSFLEAPDETTRGCGPLSLKDWRGLVRRFRIRIR